MKSPTTKSALYAALFAVNFENYHAQGPQNCDREGCDEPTEVVIAFERRCTEQAHENALGVIALHERWVTKLARRRRG